MSVEKRNEAPAEVERAASHAAKSEKSQKPVYVYLIALFAIALLLMSLSFFMSHRSSQEVMGELQESVSSFQLLQAAEERNAQLLQRVNELEVEVAQQREELFTLETELAKLQEALDEANALLSTNETP